MTHYLISFDADAMDVPAEELPAVGAAAHAVVREIQEAGALVFGGGVLYSAGTDVVAVDGAVSNDPSPDFAGRLGGMTIVDVASRDEALAWAAKIAAACRCAQDVRAYGDGSAVGN